MKKCHELVIDLENREEHLALIDNFDEDIAVLHRIPVFRSLLNPIINPEMSIVGGFDRPGGVPSRSCVSLLEWINSKGSSQSLEQVAEGCYRSLQVKIGHFFGFFVQKIVKHDTRIFLFFLDFL